MTWNEFKAEIDMRLSESGMSGDEELEYVDVSDPDRRDWTIVVESDGSISIG